MTCRDLRDGSPRTSAASRSCADEQDGVSARRLELARTRVHGEPQRLESFHAEHRFGAPSCDQRRIARLAAKQPHEYRSNPHGAVAAVGELHPDRARRSYDAQAIREISGQDTVRGAGIDENANPCGAFPGKLGVGEDVPHAPHRNKREPDVHPR